MAIYNQILAAIKPTASGSTDPYFSSTSLLMHMDNNLTDVKGNTITNAGITFSNTTFKFGSYSASLSGTTYATIPRQTLSGDCTIELWFNQTSKSANYVPLICDTIDSFSFPVILDYGGSNKVGLYLAGGVPTVQSSGAVFATGSWYHIAYSRTGTTHRVFVNGTLACSVVGTATTIHLNNIGRYTTGYGLIGFIDDVRVTNGVGRYTANFSVPTAAFPDS